MVKSKFANYNKYLRQLASFSGTSLLLKHFVVPTSVVFAWNRISLMLKGVPYDALDWEGLPGCTVCTDNITIRREDINHLIFNVVGVRTGQPSIISNISNISINKEEEDAELDVMEGTFVHGYSMQPKPVNEYYVISIPDNDDDDDATLPVDDYSYSFTTDSNPPNVPAQLTPLVVPTYEEGIGSRSLLSPMSRSSPMTKSRMVASPMNRNRVVSGESYSPQARTKRPFASRSPLNVSSVAASSRNRSILSLAQNQ